MLSLGPLGFAAPLALAGLLALPLLWMLLRATPPAPQRVAFPPLRLLAGLQPKEETPLRTPWWVILLRLALAACVVLGLARPVLFPAPPSTASGPLLVIIDDGWAAAPAWRRIQRDAIAALETAARAERPAAVMFTAARSQAEASLQPQPAGGVHALVESRAPAAWSPDHGASAVRLSAALSAGVLDESTEVLWLSDGLAHGDADTLMAVLARFAGGRIRTPQPTRAALALGPPQPAADGLSVPVLRAQTATVQEGAVLALDREGRALARAPFRFDRGDTQSLAQATLPLEVRNLVTLLRLESAASAGGTHVLDDGWRRPLIGLIAPSADVDRQPLLADLYYAEQALAASAETVRGPVSDLLDREPGALVLVDAAAPTAADREALTAFVEDGGLLIRFAGPRLAAESDGLVPVRLREGGRLLGGALAWDEPQAIAPFTEDSPFFGLAPPAEATVARQVLAEPAADLGEKTWARLADGTPFVTSDTRGRGRLVLFHVTASAEWSDTPLSGLFVEMLGRVTAFAGAAGRSADGARAAGPWRLATTLTAQGVLRSTDRDVRIDAEAFGEAQTGPSAPPGLYERGPTRTALNIMTPEATLTPLPEPPDAITMEDASADAPRPLGGALLGLALALLILDALVMAALSGRLSGWRLPRRAGAGAAGFALAAFAVWALTPPAEAQDAAAAPAPDTSVQNDSVEAFALRALGQFRLAYVVTGDPQVDAMSAAGLSGLSMQLRRRTSIEPGEPLPVNLASDEIALLPMLYWPTLRDMPAPTPEVAAKLDAFMKNGGVLVLDTRDGAANFAAAPHPGLVRLGEALDTPPLRPAPPDHVLTRAFYLLQEFPGRWRDSPVWVEADSRGAARDGVSGLIVTSADWAAAWAVDEGGRTLAALTGGPQQREHAFRVGINVVMYILTGNYKADQVHVPAILERLGQ